VLSNIVSAFYLALEQVQGQGQEEEGNEERHLREYRCGQGHGRVSDRTG